MWRTAIFVFSDLKRSLINLDTGMGIGLDFGQNLKWHNACEKSG
ncbi:hypothetical protein [Scytonema hofmannii]|nr:hypothetical protein [Scytonema hofmannii]